MTIQTTYTQARDHLAQLLDRVTNDREVVIIQRRGHEDVAMLPADELSSMLETLHLLRSPNNARRLFDALERSEAKTLKPQSIDDLRREFGLESEVVS